jgi:LTXXQ motif family protein
MLDRKTCTSLALILALAASPVLAAETEAEPHQSARSAAMPGCMMPEAEGGMPIMRMMMGQGGMPMRAEHIEGRLAFLKTELKITDEQLPLWNAFAQAMRDDASTMQAKPHAMMGMNKAATLSDKLAERETILTARIEAVRKLKAVADPLHAALNVDQKKTADEIMLGPMGMMM